MDRRGRLSRRANTRLEFKPAIIVLIIPCLDTRCLADISRRILDIRESPSSLIRERARIEGDTLKQYPMQMSVLCNLGKKDSSPRRFSIDIRGNKHENIFENREGFVLRPLSRCTKKKRQKEGGRRFIGVSN